MSNGIDEITTALAQSGDSVEIQIPRDLAKKLAHKAIDREVSVDEVAAEAIRAFIERR